jgi:hypothetical protein
VETLIGFWVLWLRAKSLSLGPSMIRGPKVSTLEPEAKGIGLGREELVEELESWSGCSMKGEGRTSRSVFGDLRNECENSRRI